MTILISWISLVSANAQIKIASVTFEGLEKTRPAFVRQYLTVAPGDAVDSLALEINRQRLVNLEMFSDVRYTLRQAAAGYHVVFRFSEIITLLPILSFGGLEDGNIWLQAGINEANLTGRGQKLTAYYQYYDRHSVVVATQMPRIKGSDWDLNLNFVKWSTLEPLYFSGRRVLYDYDNYTYGATTTYHFNYRQRLEFGGSYFTENYTLSDREPNTDTSPGPATAFRRKMLVKVINYIDRRDYQNSFLLEGACHTTVAEYVYSFNQLDAQFFIAFHDFKLFKLFNDKHNFALRARVGLSTNEESPFAPFVLDSYLNIRGVGNRVDRGTGMIVLNTEYRRLLYDSKNIAVQGVAFADTGTWRVPGGELSDFTQTENMELFAGLGARLIFKRALNTILRFDYGVDLQETQISGFVVGVGQYF